MTESLLFIKPGSLGDVVHALPCAMAIRKAWPEKPLTWLVDQRWQELLAGNPAVTKTLIFPREKFRGISGALQSIPWAMGLRHERPAVAIDLQGLLRSAIMAKLSGARQTYGLSDAREGARWFYNRVADVLPGEHAVARYLRILPMLGIEIPERPEFPLPEGSRPEGFEPAGRFILLHPFSRGRRKSLTEEHVHIFCENCAPEKVLIAGRGDALAKVPENALNLMNRTTLAEFIWLARAAAFTVSVDSGPMHIAAALTDNLLSVHTWSDPRLVGPYNDKAWIWQGGEIRGQTLNSPHLPEGRNPDDAAIASIAKWVAGRIK